MIRTALGLGLFTALALSSPSAPAAPASASAALSPPASESPAPAVVRRVSGLIERLRQHPGPEEREEVLAELVAVGPPAIPLLLAELERRDRTTWPAIVYCLGALGDARAISPLRRELRRQIGMVYMDVLYALALAGDREAPLQALRSTYVATPFSPDASAMDFIAGAVGPDLTPVLIKEIQRRAQESRVAALGALGTLCDARATPFLLDWSRQDNVLDRRSALIALARIGGRDATQPLLEALADGDASIREAAAEGLGYLRATEAAAALIKLIDGPALEPLRRRAIWSLGLIGGDQAAAALARALNGANQVDRVLLVQALGETRAPAAVEPLAGEALGRNAEVVSAAVVALAAIPGEAATARLLELCSDVTHPEAGLAAARELVVRRDPRATPCTLRRLRDEIGRRGRLEPLAEDILRQAPLLASASAAASLEAIAEGITAPALQHRVLDAAHLMRLVLELGANSEPWLELLENGAPSEADLAIMRLAELGDPRAVEPLVRLFGRIEPERAWRIPDALGRIGSERATPFLVSLLTDDLYRVPSLDRAREEAARAVARYSRSPLAAEALKKAFVADRGRLLVPLLAFARLRGAEGIPELLQLKTLLLRRRGAVQALRHEKVNWAIRLLRAGREIPLDEVTDVR